MSCQLWLIDWLTDGLCVRLRLILRRMQKVKTQSWMHAIHHLDFQKDWMIDCVRLWLIWSNAKKEQSLMNAIVWLAYLIFTIILNIIFTIILNIIFTITFIITLILIFITIKMIRNATKKAELEACATLADNFKSGLI